jgi:hypothetical protein
MRSWSCFLKGRNGCQGLLVCASPIPRGHHTPSRQIQQTYKNINFVSLSPSSPLSPSACFLLLILHSNPFLFPSYPYVLHSFPYLLSRFISLFLSETQPAITNEYLHSFLQSLQANTEISPRSGHDCSLPIHHSIIIGWYRASIPTKKGKAIPVTGREGP